METKTLVLKIKIKAKHTPGNDTIYVSKEDAYLFYRVLEQLNIQAVQHQKIGDDTVPFWFNIVSNADAIFDLWATE